MLYNFYKVDKLRARVEKAVEYFSPFGVQFWTLKVFVLILLQTWASFYKVFFIFADIGCT